jgi:hypothetical protein
MASCMSSSCGRPNRHPRQQQLARLFPAEAELCGSQVDRLIIEGENRRALRVHASTTPTGPNFRPVFGTADGRLPGTLPLHPLKSADHPPQAGVALAFARSQSVVTLQRDLGAIETPQSTRANLSGDVLFDFDEVRCAPTLSAVG